MKGTYLRHIGWKKFIQLFISLTNHISDHIGKYDDRDDEGIFLGYATNNKGYRCYNKRLHKLVDCINIKVDEEVPVRNVSSVEPST